MASSNGSSNSHGSEDMARMQAILREAGVVDFEPRVLNQLLDVAYATTAQLLTGAKVVSQHCGKMVIDETDVQIATEFSGILNNPAPNRMKLYKMADEKNEQPLPQIRHNFGLKLPNDRFCLYQQNVEWKANDPITQSIVPAPVRQEPSPLQLRPEHAVNLLKRKHEDDFDS